MALRPASLATALLLLANNAPAALFKVGDTVQDGCDFSSIQDAIDAAAANGSAMDTIRVSNSGSYSSQALQIGDQSVFIEGGFDSCTSGQIAAPADIGGDGVATVIRIAPLESTAQRVILSGLHIHGGGTWGYSAPSGGGIYVTNNVLLTITDSLIDQNAGISGGGIYIDGDHGIAQVVLDRGTQIRDNLAVYYGGGVNLTGGGLYVLADGVLIDGNQAAAGGGGIAATNGLVSVGNPDARPGKSDAIGATISNNHTSGIGGGLLLYGPSALLYANELIVDGNSANGGGGGIAAGANAYVSMARDYPAAAIQCPAWRECSRISNNTVGAGEAGTHGGALALSSGARADIAQTILRGNSAQDGSVAYVDAASLYFESVLATANQSFDVDGGTGATIRTRFLGAENAVKLRIAWSTFAANREKSTQGQNADAIDVIAQQYTQLSIYSTTFYDSYYPIVGYSAYTDDCVVEGTGGVEGHGSHTRLLTDAGDAFNNAAAGDFRLRSASPLNDYCDASAFAPAYRDIVLTPRCHDDPRKPNGYGACDVGAYESDHLFGDGFQ